MPRGLVRLLVVGAVMLAGAVPAKAQVIRGTVKAQQTDAVVPGARVTVTDTANGVLAEVVSGPDGKFHLAFRTAGRFVVGVRKVGWVPSFTDTLSAAATDTIMVDLLVPADPTEIATAEISARAPSTFNSRAIAEARRRGWKVYPPEIVDRFRDVAGNFIDLMRESGATGVNLSSRDCVRSLRYNRCLTYIIDGQPAGTNVFIHPRDVYFFAVLSASEAAVQWGDRAAWGAVVVYTRMSTDRRKP